MVEAIEPIGSKRKKQEAVFPMWEIPVPQLPFVFPQPPFLKCIFDSLSRVSRCANENTAMTLQQHIVESKEADDKRVQRLWEQRRIFNGTIS